MIAGLALVGALILIVLALFHVAWAFGGRTGANAAIPTRPDGTPLIAPGPGGTLVVAALLLTAAFLLLERAGLGPGWLGPTWQKVGTTGVAAVFLLRAVGDFRYVGLFKRERSTRFARMDTRLYTPLVLTLAALIGIVTLAAGCGHTAGAGAPPQPSPANATQAESYLGLLLAGDRVALAHGFSDQPSIDDPFAGAVRGTEALDVFVGERLAWLAARAARLTSGPITRADGRTVVEAVLRLHHDGRDIDLPIAVVGEDAPAGRVRALRVYHSFWPLEGHHRVRAPLLRPDPGAHVVGAVADYQRALAAGDVDAIVATFEPDGYFREPSGEPWVHRGQAELRKFMTQILGAGGVGIEHASVTDDGMICAIEFNAVRFGKRPIAPQAGLAIYERGPSGRLRAARIYDDVNVEVLQKQ